MKPGDMAQLDDERRIDRQFRATVALGGGVLLLMLMATGVGLFFGWIIWGIK
jgi:hypothetical protein